MNKTTKITLIAIAVIILGFVGYTVFASKADDTNPQQTPKQLYIDKYAQIGSLKYEEMEYNRKAQEAKEAKDKILEELNGTGDTGKLIK